MLLFRERVANFEGKGVVVPVCETVEAPVDERVKLGRMEEARRWTRPGPSEGKRGGEEGGEGDMKMEEVEVEVEVVVCRVGAM